MGVRGKRQQRYDLPINRQQRESIERELSDIPALDPRLSKLMSVEGFIDYYLRMIGLYPSNRLAYEKLEEFHETLIGRRRYSDFKSFLIILDRYLKSIRNK